MARRRTHRVHKRKRPAHVVYAGRGKVVKRKSLGKWAREELNLRPHAYQPGSGDTEVRHLHRKTIDGRRDLPG